MVSALVIAFSTYSRIPMPRAEWSEENRKYAMCFFPLIGAVIGVILALWLFLCDRWQAGAFLRGCVAAVIPLMVTGGIHMDGFMDTSDAMASWQPRERRLEILKDSHTGAFAVMGCAVDLLLSAGIFSEATFSDSAMLAMVFVLSRTLSAWTLTHFQSARPGGMLDSFAKTAQKRMVEISSAVYIVFCALVWTLCSPWRGICCLTAALACVLLYKRKADRYFGGVTGDLAGWFVQVIELILSAIVILGGKIG